MTSSHGDDGAPPNHSRWRARGSMNSDDINDTLDSQPLGQPGGIVGHQQPGNFITDPFGGGRQHLNPGPSYPYGSPTGPNQPPHFGPGVGHPGVSGPPGGQPPNSGDHGLMPLIGKPWQRALAAVLGLYRLAIAGIAIWMVYDVVWYFIDTAHWLTLGERLMALAVTPQTLVASLAAIVMPIAALGQLRQAGSSQPGRAFWPGITGAVTALGVWMMIFYLIDTPTAMFVAHETAFVIVLPAMLLLDWILVSALPSRLGCAAPFAWLVVPLGLAGLSLAAYEISDIVGIADLAPLDSGYVVNVLILVGTYFGLSLLLVVVSIFIGGLAGVAKRDPHQQQHQSGFPAGHPPAQWSHGPGGANYGPSGPTQPYT